MNPEENKASQSNPADNSVLFGILSYLGILVIISFIFARNNPTVKFHIKQGLTILCLEIIVWILGSISWQLWAILNIVNLAALIFSIIGIVNVVQKKEKQLPLIGQFAKYFTF